MNIPFAVCNIWKNGQFASEQCNDLRDCDKFYQSHGERFFANEEITHRGIDGIHYYDLIIGTEKENYNDYISSR